MLRSQNTTPASQARELERGLIRLRARIREENAGLSIPHLFNELGGDLHHRLAGKEIRHVAHGGHLAAHRLHDGRVRIAQGIHRDARQHVDVLVPLFVGNSRAAARNDGHRRGPIGVAQHLRPALVQRSVGSVACVGSVYVFIAHCVSSFLNTVPSG